MDDDGFRVGGPFQIPGGNVRYFKQGDRLLRSRIFRGCSSGNDCKPMICRMNAVYV